jgi:hypothetical protein
MKNVITILLLFSFTYSISQVSQNNVANKNQTLQNTMKIAPLFPSKNYNECMGISLDMKKKDIFFTTHGKYIHKYSLLNAGEPKLIATINEVKDKWNDDYGDTFIHEIELGKDGFIYAVAETCILKINPTNGKYTTIIKDDFIGPWGAYGLDMDSVGNIYVGDHYGGIHVYIKNKKWSKKTIVSSPENSVKKSFGGVLLKNDMLYYLDFENSSLKSSSIIWKNGFPEIINAKTLDLPVPYPEFMQIWKGDIFVKAARENTMLRIRNNEVIQQYSFTSDKEVSPIVTFSLDIVNDNKCIFYGMSWGPNGTLHQGDLNW